MNLLLSNPYTKLVTRLALTSSSLIFLLQFLFRLILPAHVNDGFRHVELSDEKKFKIDDSFIDFAVKFLFIGFTEWDSQHYLHLASYGWIFEHSIAFGPIFPLILRFLAGILKFVTFHSLSNISALILAGFLLSNFCFLVSCHLLYHFTFKMYKNENLSIFVIYFFSLNPASIFFRTIYTESLFFSINLLNFWCIFHEKFAYSLILCSISTLVRSNGLLNFGFLLHGLITKFSTEFFQIDRRSLLVFLQKWSILLLIACCPYFMWQYYLKYSFCRGKVDFIDPRFISVAVDRGYAMVGELEKLSICNSSSLPFGVVQKLYWNVGFLQYYRLKLIPCFLLATPCFLLTLATIKHFCSYFHLKKQINVWIIFHQIFRKDSHASHVLHLLFLTAYSLLFVNVEIMTRMLFSSSILLFWFCGHSLKDLENFQDFSPNQAPGLFKFYGKLLANSRTCLLAVYFLIYSFLGTILHTNGYPWT